MEIQVKITLPAPKSPITYTPETDKLLADLNGRPPVFPQEDGATGSADEQAGPPGIGVP